MLTSAWARDLAEGLLARDLPRRWAHVKAVASRAEEIASIFSAADASLLCNAAVLHDVGYAPGVNRTGFHALDGASYLRGRNVDQRLCALVAHHSCAYREAELRGLEAELSAWIDERSALTDALWWADMTTTPDGKITNVHDRIEEIQRRYGPDDLVSFFVRQAKTELVAAVERTEERLVVAGINYTEK